MRAVTLDVSVLGLDDLRALRLGVQVVGHRAALESRPHVATFLGMLMSGLDDAIARRSRTGGAWDGSISLQLDEPPNRPGEVVPDRELVVEYVELLRANLRLSIGVRAVCESLVQQLRR